MIEAHSLEQWCDRFPELVSRSWTLVGKGPSADLWFRSVDSDYSIGINHVWSALPPGKRLTALHAFDIDVVEGLTEHSLERFQFLFLPSRMNVAKVVGVKSRTVHMRDSVTTLERFTGNKVVGQLARDGRLVVYDRGNRDTALADPAVRVGAFSGSTVIALLAKIGVKNISLAGIDGGTDYANAFQALNDSTRLNGGQPSFDEQLEEIALLRRALGLTITQYGQKPLRIFVGTEEAQRLAFKVLQHSIETHSSRSVEIAPLCDAIAAAGLSTQFLEDIYSGGTPFSFQRYLIPELCNYQGHAIYLDSDMQVFADIQDLARYKPSKGCYNAAHIEADWNRPPQLSVLVIDCEKARWTEAELRESSASAKSYESFVKNGPTPGALERTIPSYWNSLENYAKGETRLLHYTSMATQPWLSVSNPLANLWCSALGDALDEGFVSLQEVESDVVHGYVRPGLLEQAKARLWDPLSLPRSVIKSDQAFLPPHALTNHPGVARAAGIGDPLPGPAKLAVRRGLGIARRTATHPSIMPVVKPLVRRVQKLFNFAARLIR